MRPLFALSQVPRLMGSMLIGLIERFNKNTFYKNVAWIASGTAAAQVITVLSAPIVTRLYTPLDYGIFTVFTAILGVLQPLSTLTYAITIPLAENDYLAHNILKLCFSITIVLSLLLGITVFLAGDMIAVQFAVPEAAQYMWLLPLCLLFLGFYEALSGWAVRRKLFSTISITEFSKGASSAGIIIGLGWLGFQPFGLLLGLLAKSTVGCLNIGRKLIQKEPQALRNFSWSKIYYAAKRFKVFPLYRSWSKLLLALNNKLPIFIMTALFSTSVVGLFGLAYNMIDLPISLLGRSVAKVYYAEIASLGKSRPDKILKLSILIMKRMFFVSIPIVGFIMIAGPWGFSVFFGTEWYNAGVYARLLSIISFFRLLGSPLAGCFDVFEMQGTQLILNIIQLILISTVYIISKFFGLNALSTVSIFCFMFSLYYIITIICIYLVLKKKASAM